MANAGIIKSYDFDSSLTDTLGNGVDLTASGGAVSAGRYSFTNNQGLRLTSALSSTTDYGIEIKFQMNDSLSGYNKLIDFQDLASDLGLYELNGGIRFYTASGAFGSVSLNTDFTIGLARSAGAMELFLDGVSIFSGSDGSSQGVSGANTLNFFEDDSATGQVESFTGSVDFIRIHDDSSTFGTAPVGTVPEPSTYAMLILGLAALGYGRRKKA
jgi:hypothetical protein